MKRSIAKIRTEYGKDFIYEERLHVNPIDQFCLWLDEAILARVMEPNGMILATVSRDGRPSTRTVLLKQISQTGFVFYTHYTSRKAQQIFDHPFGSLTFWWKEIYRQVCIEGFIRKISRSQSVSYFAQRPRGAQIAAHASNQSDPLAHRLELDQAYTSLQAAMRGKKIDCPKTWGGFCLEPDRMEFWQGRKNRLHDRFVYVRVENDWIRTRLSP